MPLAPIALFVYNRLSHTRRTLDALRANPLAAQSEIIIFSDGPKRDRDLEKVREIREYLKGVGGFRRVTVVERSGNMGLARSIIAGVTQLVTSHGRVIVLEDDMVTSPHFLDYMNDSLELYQDEEMVISVAAYFYPVGVPLPATFFLKGTDCWGWGTWKRGWDLFDPDGPKLLEELERKRLTRKFDLDGVYPYTRMLRKQIAGENDSWAIRWYASAFLKDRLTLYPASSLLQNIGNDGGGTHSSSTDVFDVELADKPLTLEKLEPVENAAAGRALRNYFHRTRNSIPALIRRVLGKILR